LVLGFHVLYQFQCNHSPLDKPLNLCWWTGYRNRNWITGASLRYCFGNAVNKIYFMRLITLMPFKCSFTMAERLNTEYARNLNSLMEVNSVLCYCQFSIQLSILSFISFCDVKAGTCSEAHCWSDHLPSGLPTFLLPWAL
jgi:hypothetical protein